MHGFSNAVALTLPALQDAPQLYRRTTALDLLAAAVESWEPDWATVTSHPLRRAQGAAGGTVYGWATWRAGQDPAADARLRTSMAHERRNSCPLWRGLLRLMPWKLLPRLHMPRRTAAKVLAVKRFGDRFQRSCIVREGYGRRGA